METPIAISDPTDEQDRVLSELLWRADELRGWFQGEELGGDGPLARLARGVHEVLEAEPAFAQLLRDVPRAMGTGLSLTVVFERLFGTERKPLAVRVPSFEAQPRLTDRQVAVAECLSRGLEVKRIARELGIAEGTVRKHKENLFAALTVSDAEEAVSRAIAFGYLPNPAAHALPLGLKGAVSPTPLTRTIVPHEFWRSAGSNTKAVEALAAAGMGLMVLATMPAHVEQSLCQPAIAKVVELDSGGRQIGELALDTPLRVVRAMAVAPEASARKGFEPGAIYLAESCNPDPVNRDRILEVLPGGVVRRAFTGGRYVSARLIGCMGLAFLGDGRLAAGSASGTDAVLAFSEGGAKVERLLSVVPYSQIALSKAGGLLVAGGSSKESGIWATDRHGKVIRRVERPGSEHYRGVAELPDGSLLGSRRAVRAIERLSSSGEKISERSFASQHPYHLALARGQLYFLDRDPPSSFPRAVASVSATLDGPVREVPLATGLVPTALCPTPRGTVLVLLRRVS